MRLSLLPRNSTTKTALEDTRAVEPLSAVRIAAIYDLHGRRAYSLAMMVLAEPREAAAALEEAFRSLRHDAKAKDEAAHARTRLLQLVYAAAIKRDPARTSQPFRAPTAAMNALPPNERNALALCLHGVTCTALDASECTPPGTTALRLHRALSLLAHTKSRDAVRPY